MKKEYIEPATEVVAIAPCNLIADSQTGVTVDPNPEIDDNTPGHVKGDRGGDWDMDW